MKKNSNLIGSKAEDLACEYITKLGYKIVKRNFHFGRLGEIDIIAYDNDILVFIEVKARSKNSYGNPIDYITPKKQAIIKKVAEGYYYVNNIQEQEARFDVILIDLDKSLPKIEYIKNAFL